MLYLWMKYQYKKADLVCSNREIKALSKALCSTTTSPRANRHYGLGLVKKNNSH